MEKKNNNDLDNNKKLKDMTHYTIGIYFNKSFTHVVLILKNRPQWQKGLHNFPGGHKESHESIKECITREFEEECGIKTMFDDWWFIGEIYNNKNDYTVSILTAIKEEVHGDIKTNEDQIVKWVPVNQLPKKRIANIQWLVFFALNYWKGSEVEKLKVGYFCYEPY